MGLRIGLMVTAYLFASGAAGAADWEHRMLPPEPLTDELLQKTFPAETRPAKHNGITVTNYLETFDLKVTEPKPGCHRPTIAKWVATTRVYVRPKSVEGEKGAAAPSPRWQKLADFKCREPDKEFNTWEGTAYHERQHAELRDRKLREFWTGFRRELASHCSPDAEAAQVFALKKIEPFLLAVREADSEDEAERLEHAWYQREFTKTAKQKCGKHGYLRQVFASPRLEEKGDTFVLKDPKLGELKGLKRGTLFALTGGGSTYYFQHGSILAKEATEEGVKVRYEYRVDTSLKSKSWLGENEAVVAKAWADPAGQLGERVELANATDSGSKPALVAVIDTGYEAGDPDGHGTLVQSLVQASSGLSEAEVFWARTSTNLDDTLWSALAKTKARIINLSIGQGVNSEAKPTEAAIQKTCALLKTLSRDRLVVMGAGNDGSELEKAPFYPAACPWADIDNVIVVGSYDALNRGPADFGRSSSNWSAKAVHALVSGALYEGRWPGGTPALQGGTSYAAAYVSGLAARALKAEPKLKAGALRAGVLKNCVKTSEAASYVKDGCVLTR